MPQAHLLTRIRAQRLCSPFFPLFSVYRGKETLEKRSCPARTRK